MAFVDEGHRNEQKVMFMKLAAVIERIPNFGGISYEENVGRFFQSWVEDTKKMDLAKVKDGYSGAPWRSTLHREFRELKVMLLVKGRGRGP